MNIETHPTALKTDPINPPGRQQPIEDFIGRMQERYGYDRQRAIKELRRRLTRHKVRRSLQA